jgi:hypothetical protein
MSSDAQCKSLNDAIKTVPGKIRSVDERDPKLCRFMASYFCDEE